MTHITVCLPRGQIDQVLAVIPPCRQAERLAFRLIVDWGLLPLDVLRLTVADVHTQGVAVHLRIGPGKNPPVVVLRDRALVQEVETYLQQCCWDGYLFREPYTTKTGLHPHLRAHDLPVLPPPHPENTAMSLQTLKQRWAHYCTVAHVTIKLMSIVHQYQYARRRRHCPHQDLAQIRRTMQTARARQAA